MTRPADGAGARAKPTLEQVLTAAVDAGSAYLRTVDADAAVAVEQVRRRSLTRPSVVAVGETKRGKSSLVNALVGVVGLSPVDAAVTTATPVQLRHGDRPEATVWLLGRAEPVPVDPAQLADWVTGRATPDAPAPRRVRVRYPAPLLEYLTLVDTPGAGGLDPAHTEVALDAAGHADALLFVVDAAAPFTQVELDFLVEASKRVNGVLFALTKIDAYPGWRQILADNQQQLRAYAPRFSAAPWFPVSARLAEMALTVPPPAAGELVDGSGVPALQHALVDLAGRGHLLRQANLVRMIRSELVRLDADVDAQLRAVQADPGEAGRIRRERAAVSARRRTESRQWSLALGTETTRARIEAVGWLRGYLAEAQEELTERIGRAHGEQLAALPQEVDRALQALSVRLSADLRARFDVVGERVLAQVFTAEERRPVLHRLNATLRHALASRPPRDGGGGTDQVMIALSAGSMAFLAGRGAMAGASALGATAVLGGGLLIPVAGLGLGLAAGAFVLHRRRVQNDRQQARVWLREVLAEARATLTDEITHRFTDLQYALTLALDEAIERRLHQLDAHLAEVERAAGEEQAARSARRAAALARRDRLRARLGQLDEVLTRARALVPAQPAGQRR